MSIPTQAIMCRSHTCTKAQGCYRYRAIPVESPRVQVYGKPKTQGDACNRHIGLHGRTDIRDINVIREGVKV